MSFYELPKLPYGYDALEPVIDAKTMEIHYSKHHQGYVNNLNKALESYPDFKGGCVCDLLREINKAPQDIQTALINNGGGHINHRIFWTLLTAPNSSNYHGDIAQAIDQKYGSLAAFKEAFTKAAMTRFGSGWAWLVLKKDKTLEIKAYPNQNSPFLDDEYPILGLDVWEHAYYLNYQNRRNDYVDSFFSIINWDVVNARYLKGLKK